jgi:hypothetical protein
MDQKKFRTTLEMLLAVPGNERLADRMMYGTDWHMIFRLKDHPRYLAAFEKAFDSPALRKIRDRFFHENAMRYLKLPASTTSRTRNVGRSRRRTRSKG